MVSNMKKYSRIILQNLEEIIIQDLITIGVGKELITPIQSETEVMMQKSNQKDEEKKEKKLLGETAYDCNYSRGKNHFAKEC